MTYPTKNIMGPLFPLLILSTVLLLFYNTISIMVFIFKLFSNLFIKFNSFAISKGLLLSPSTFKYITYLPFRTESFPSITSLMSSTIYCSLLKLYSKIS